MVPRMSPACSIASSVRSTRRKRDLGVLTGACTWRLRRLIVTTSHGARPPPGSGGARPLKLTTPRSLSCRFRGWPDAGPGAPAPEPACSCARDRTGRSADAGADGHPRHRRIDDPPAHRSEVLLQAESRGKAEGNQQSFPEREDEGKIAQRAKANSAGACGSRAARPAGGNAGPDRALHAREGNGEAPLAALACSVARAGASEGGARCAARATRP